MGAEGQGRKSRRSWTPTFGAGRQKEKRRRGERESRKVSHEILGIDSILFNYSQIFKNLIILFTDYSRAESPFFKKQRMSATSKKAREPVAAHTAGKLSN